jgi:hypothetical protein
MLVTSLGTNEGWGYGIGLCIFQPGGADKGEGIVYSTIHIQIPWSEVIHHCPQLRYNKVRLIIYVHVNDKLSRNYQILEKSSIFLATFCTVRLKSRLVLPRHWTQLDQRLLSTQHVQNVYCEPQGLPVMKSMHMLVAQPWTNIDFRKKGKAIFCQESSKTRITVCAKVLSASFNLF